MVYDEFLIKSAIRSIQDWPQKGLQFRDITPLFHNPKTARMVTDAFAQRYIDKGITHIAAIDARGFLLGSNLAYILNKPLVLIRKAGSLPGEVDREDYQREHTPGTLEIQRDALLPDPLLPDALLTRKESQAPSVLLIDDLISSGGTMMAAAQLIRRQGGHVAEAAAIIDLPDEGGTNKLMEAEVPVFTLCAFEN